MNVSRNQVSLGALVVVLSLAFPMGVISLFSPATTGDQIDAADSVVMASVEAMQVIPESDRTVLELSVDHLIVGAELAPELSLVVDGRPPVEVGDMVVAMLSNDPVALLGAYRVEKSPTDLSPQVVSPITGMWNQGIGDYPPVDLGLFETAVRVRVGILDPSVLQAAIDGGALPPPGSALGMVSVPDDAYEPNNTVQEATDVDLTPEGPLAPPKLITGMPLRITGLTLTPGDVDFFSFNGSALSIVHAITAAPEGATSLDLDTIIGLFDGDTRELLAWDDDSGVGTLSKLVTPLTVDGPYAIGVESAPDTDLDFSGDEGLTTGAYELKLELQRASFLTNFDELVVGVSPDGTFIQDFIGFREIGGIDVLLTGAQTDGWGMRYDALFPGGLTSVNQGAGDHQGDPGFDAGLPIVPGSFVIGPYVDQEGFNRAGFAKSSALVPYQLLPRRGMQLVTEYTLGLNSNTVNGTFEFISKTEGRVFDLAFSRLMDVDLFGDADPGSTSDDHFFWSFSADDQAKAFAVPAGENVNSFTEPALGTDDAVGDFQAALIIEHGDIGSEAGFQNSFTYDASFTLVSGFDTEEQARQGAVNNLVAEGATTWVVAVDEDPDSGKYTAFGAGLSGPND